MMRHAHAWSCLAITGVLLAHGAPVHAADAPSAIPDLAPVVVSAPMLREQTLIDRKVYDVGADLQRSFGSISEVLAVIPALTVDADGVVSLRGDSNVLILLNGKPSAQFSGAAAGENLLSLSAQDIEQVEVLTTPPAQYKADGASGVINIITRKKRPPGAVGQVQAGAAPQGREVLGGGASWQSGPLTAAASINFRQDVRQRQIRSDVRTPSSGALAATDSRVATDETIRRATPTVSLNVEDVLDERQSLSGSVSWTERGGLRTYTELTQSSVVGGGITGAARRQSAGHDPETDVDARLGYTRKLAQNDGTLALSLHRSGSHQHEHYAYADSSLVPPQAAVSSRLDFLESHVVTDLGVDYAATLPEQQKLKLGCAFELDQYGFANLALLSDPATGALVPDSNSSNNFDFRQRIHAGYGSYQARAGGWTWLGGVRLEQTLSEAWQLSTRAYRAGSDFKAYPSLHLDRSLSDTSTLSFGVSQRIARPQPENLNPYVNREYTPNLQAGNADLRPQYTNSFEVGYERETQGGSAGLTGYFRRNKDSMTSITRYLGNGVSLTTLANLPRNDAAGAEFTRRGHLGSRLSYSVSGNLFHTQIDASALGASGLQSTNGLNAKLKLDYQPVPGDTGQLTVTRTDRRLTPQGSISAVNLVNLGYRHKLRPDLTTVVTVSDLFNGQHYERMVSTPSFTGSYLRSVDGRVLYVGLIHAFGSTRNGEPVKFDYDE